MDDRAREAVMALRSDWRFFAVHAFCHAFAAVLRLPAFTCEDLERSLLDPTEGELLCVEVCLRLIEDPPRYGHASGRERRLAVNDWESRLLEHARVVADDSDVFDEDYPALGDGANAHPLATGDTFFDLSPTARLALLHAFCEHRLESEDDPACNEEAKAQADAHADRANEETHPGCHGEQIGADGDGRTYHVTGDDLRVYRWEKSKGRAHPAWSTACTTTSEALALANAFAESKSPKERALGTYLLETHLPAHLAEEEKRASREKSREAKEAAARARERERAEYDERAKKRSGRIAVKQAEEEERRRRREAELEAAAAIAAAAREKREATQLERWRWMLLPPRLRSKDVPQGMDPRGSDARVRLLARESADERAAREKIETPRGEDAIGRYVLTYWDDDETWYVARVESYDAAADAHALRYVLDDELEAGASLYENARAPGDGDDGTRALRRGMVFTPVDWDPSSAIDWNPSPELPGLERRGVRLESRKHPTHAYEWSSPEASRRADGAGREEGGARAGDETGTRTDAVATDATEDAMDAMDVGPPPAATRAEGEGEGEDEDEDTAVAAAEALAVAAPKPVEAVWEFIAGNANERVQ
jgi:hypothetical protein